MREAQRWEIVRVWRSATGWQLHSQVIKGVWATNADEALDIFDRARASVGVTGWFGEVGARPA